MKLTILSTFSEKGYLEYGKNFIESCEKNLSDDIELKIYIDNTLNSARINFLNYKENVPKMVEFVKRNAHRLVTDWTNDGVRFAYKVYAMCAESHNPSNEILIWLDGDTVIEKKIDKNYFLKFLKPDKFLYYIGRKNIAETGFLMFNLKHQDSKTFFEILEHFYNQDKVYELTEFHDAYVITHIINNYPISSQDITFGTRVKHPLNYVFHGNIVHYKGKHKSKSALNEHLQFKKRNKIGKFGNG